MYQYRLKEIKVGDTEIRKGVKTTVSSIDPETGAVTYDVENVADFTWKDKAKGEGVWTYGLEYEIPWEPPVKTAKDLTRSGTAREGITYSGPYLFSYLERDWGAVMNKYSVAVIESETQDLSVPNDNILQSEVGT